MSLDQRRPKGYRKAWNGGKPPVLKEVGPSHFFVAMTGRGLCGDDEGPFSLTAEGTSCDDCLRVVLNAAAEQRED
jgi:hypothetical protein